MKTETQSKILSGVFCCLLLAFNQAGCSDNSDSSGSRDFALVEQCSGDYQCAVGEAHTPAQAKLEKMQGECFAVFRGGDKTVYVILAADGTYQDEDGSIEWFGDEDQWDAHIRPAGARELGISCESLNAKAKPAPAQSSANKKCVGTPESCSSRTVGHDCWGGCYMNYSNSCSGTPYDCDRFYGESSCRAEGCRWE